MSSSNIKMENDGISVARTCLKLSVNHDQEKWALTAWN